jgi:zinc protease
MRTGLTKTLVATICLGIYGCDSVNEFFSTSDSETSANVEVPEKSNSKNIPDLPYESFRLANGLNVVLHQDAKLSAVNVNIWYHVGSKDEEPGKTGLAHFFEHLMFQGSKNVKEDYFSQIERAGASIKSGGVDGLSDFDHTSFYQTVPTPSLEYVLWMESDRMGYLIDNLDEKGVEKVKAIIANELRQKNSQPYSSQRRLLTKNMYPANHPYSHPQHGLNTDINNYTINDIKKFFYTFYRPNNASLTLSGNFDPDIAKQLILKYFGPLQAGPSLTRPKEYIPELKQNKLVIRMERTPQVKLTMAWHVPGFFDKSEASLKYAAQILGSGNNSHLYKKLVRESKVATQVAAYVDTREISSQFVVEAMVSPKISTDQVKSLIKETISSLAKNGPTSDELKSRIATQEYSFISQLERIGGFGGKADYFNRYYSYLGSSNAFKQDYIRYTKVTANDVSENLERWVASKNYTEIRFLPDTSTRSQIAEFDRTKTPSLAGNVPVKIPEIKKTILANGLELYVHTRSDLPKLEIAMMIKHGDLAETLKNSGVSYFTTALMAFGTDGNNAQEIQAKLDSYGSRMSSEGGKFGAAIGMASLKKNINETMPIFSETIRNPTFPEEELELVRKLRLNQILNEAKNPNSLANKLFPQILFANKHPAGMPASGSLESIKSLKRMDLVENHKIFWRPNNAALLMVGDITLEDAEKLAQTHFGSWEKGPVPQVKIEPAGAPKSTYVFLVDSQGAAQTQIRIGSAAAPRNSPDYFTTHIMNSLLGGTFTSRLNANLRESKGWAYGAYSSFIQRKDYGYWMVRTSVQTKATIVALEEIKKEIQRMSKSGNLEDGELNNLKKNMSRNYLQNFETLSQITRQVAPLITNNVPFTHLNQYITSILGQSKEAITEAAIKYLDMNKSIVLIVGDLRVIEKAVVDLKWGETYVLAPDGKVLRRGGEVPPPPKSPSPQKDAPKKTK